MRRLNREIDDRVEALGVLGTPRTKLERPPAQRPGMVSGKEGDAGEQAR